MGYIKKQPLKKFQDKNLHGMQLPVIPVFGGMTAD
jgi:hypothetical protein